MDPITRREIFKREMLEAVQESIGDRPRIRLNFVSHEKQEAKEHADWLDWMVSGTCINPGHV